MNTLKRAACAALAAGVTMAAHAADRQRVWVEAAPGKLPTVEKLLAKQGITPIYRFDRFDALVIEAPGRVLDGLRGNPAVIGIEEDAKRYLNAQEVPYGIDMVQARDIWDADTDGSVDAGAPTGAGRMVCIIDSGIDSEHPDLAGLNLVGGFPRGWDTDSCGHGSHVAGTIAAVNNDLGVVGVSPGAVDLYIAKVFDGADCAWSYSSGVANAALRCMAAGADVINMSLGGGRPSRIEERVFDLIAANGVLPVASAGNDGTTSYNYPASYPAVMSVAALDDSMTVADFSQKNDAVEIAGPGVNVLSTVPFAINATFSVAGSDYAAIGMDGSAEGSASGALVDGGLCTAPGAWSGLVVLCQRGDITFAEKVAAVEAGGGTAAAVYNNEPGGFSGTLGEDPSDIPAVSLSQEDGLTLVSTALGEVASVTVETVEHGYAYYSGTSMSAPHVTGVAAVLLSSNAVLSGAEVRAAINATALDLGDTGRDVAYGYGLVQAYDAWQYLGAASLDTRPPLKARLTQIVAR